MNRLSLYALLGSLMLGYVLLLSNSGGRAAAASAGNTGAPGEVATCTACHNASINVTSSLRLLEGTNPVTTYVPGREYVVEFSVVSSATTTRGYGFQMLALRDRGDFDIRGFNDPNQTNNYMVVAIPNGREYAEHAGISTEGKFLVNWKAPVAGSGSVTIYAAGNAVNRNGGTSGDNGSNTLMKVSEETTSTRDIAAASAHVQVWPNPVKDQVNVGWTAPQSGIYHITVRDLTGRSVYQNTQSLGEGAQVTPIGAASWERGAYIVNISNGVYAVSKKIIKM